MLSILFGIFAIIGGLSGALVLRGTNSSGALVVAGVVLIGRGIYQLAKRSSSTVSSAPVAPTREQTEYEREIQAAYDRAKGRTGEP